MRPVVKSNGEEYCLYLLAAVKSNGEEYCEYLLAQVKSNGEKYHEYLLANDDDLLSISWQLMKTMLRIKEKFREYLGAVLWEMKTKNGKECWTQSDDKYLAASVENMESNLQYFERWRLRMARSAGLSLMTST